jgi:hypothetical protein
VQKENKTIEIIFMQQNSKLKKKVPEAFTHPFMVSRNQRIRGVIV